MSREKRRTRKMTMVLVAALIGILAIGCAAYAAAPMIRRVFQRNIEQIEQLESRTNDEKFQAELEDIEAYFRGHEVSADVLFKGSEVTLTYVDFRPNDEDAEGSGRLSISLEYPGMPPFDPNFVDFIVQYNGSDYSMDVGDGLKEHRSDYAPATTLEELLEDDWFGNTSYDAEGVLSTSLWFSVPDWRLDVATPMELRATIDGEELVIPFTFDPQAAHEEAVAWAQESMKAREIINVEEKDWLKEWADHSVEVGIVKSHGGHEITLSEISYVEGGISFTLTFGGLSEEEHDRTFGSYYKKLFWIDGIAVPHAGEGRMGVEGDTKFEIYSVMLNREPLKLPDESVLYMQYAASPLEPEDYVEFIFRYRWQTGEVTVPRDEEEERAWIDEQNALYAENEKVMSQRLTFDLGSQQREFDFDGLKLSVNEIWMENHEIVVEFTYAYENAKNLWVNGWDSSTFNGLAAVASGSTTGNGRESIGFLPQDNLIELNDLNEFIVNMEVGVYDGLGNVLKTADVEMAFTLDKTTAHWGPNPFAEE